MSFNATHRCIYFFLCTCCSSPHCPSKADNYLTNAQEQSNSLLCCLWKYFQCIEQTVDVMHFSALSQSHSHSRAHCPPAGLSDCFPAPGPAAYRQMHKEFNGVDLIRESRGELEKLSMVWICPPHPPQPIGQTRCIDRGQWGIVLVPWSLGWEQQTGQTRNELQLWVNDVSFNKTLICFKWAFRGEGINNNIKQCGVALVRWKMQVEHSLSSLL